MTRADILAYVEDAVGEERELLVARLAHILLGDSRLLRLAVDRAWDDHADEIREVVTEHQVESAEIDAEIEASTVIDEPYESIAADVVHSIETRLHPIDVGYDLRARGVAVALPPDETTIVSYPDVAGARRVMRGPRDQIRDRLRRLGFDVL